MSEKKKVVRMYVCGCSKRKREVELVAVDFYETPKALTAVEGYRHKAYDFIGYRQSFNRGLAERLGLRPTEAEAVRAALSRAREERDEAASDYHLALQVVDMTEFLMSNIEKAESLMSSIEEGSK